MNYRPKNNNFYKSISTNKGLKTMSEKIINLFFLDEIECSGINQENPSSMIPYYKIKMASKFNQSMITALKNFCLKVIEENKSKEIYFDTCSLSEHQLNILSLIYIDLVCTNPHLTYKIVTMGLQNAVKNSVNGVIGNLSDLIIKG